ncbi:MAG TPA: ferritin [Bacteroidales bacterium]|nr:ferritin [Bacteroidales bacterium]HPS16673.1 ferritin [Bacteroidales bacterium]
MNKKIENILNRQVDREAYSSQLYLAMASWAEASGLEGISQWFYVQSDEERLHMLKFIHYINERGGNAIVPSIKLPPAKFKDVADAFAQTLKHEEFITASINEIVALCNSEKDFTTQNFVQWFVAEQIQEEKSARAIIDKINLLGKQNLYLLDKDIMAMRAAAEPGGGAAPVA